MAKAKKEATQSEPITAKEVIENEPIVAETIAETEALEAEVMEAALADEDIAPDSDEVLFLQKLLYIMDSGGWGKHLHPHIEERIANLKK